MAPQRPDHTEYHRRFTEAIIAEIRKGTTPWQKPWKPGESYRPENLATGRAYAGGNSLYLAVRGDQRGFGDNRWATYRQIQSAGGQVRKGECGEKVLFFDNTRKIPVKDSEGRPKKDAEGHQVYQIARREIPYSGSTPSSTWSRRTASS